MNLVIPHTAVFGVLSGALSEAVKGVVSWIDPIQLAVDSVLSERLAGKAKKGGDWLLGV